jgi:hypothetical protein
MVKSGFRLLWNFYSFIALDRRWRFVILASSDDNSDRYTPVLSKEKVLAKSETLTQLFSEFENYGVTSSHTHRLRDCLPM